MGTIKRWLKGLGSWEYTSICLLLVINLAVHFSIIQNPQALVFDEKFYIYESRGILQSNTDDLTPHPPLGKLIITAGVIFFGDNPFGWRTFSIIFGTANILLLYLICRQLGISPKGANIAAFLLTFENLSFVQGSIAMLDVFSLTFTLLAFWLYLRHKYPLSGFFVALSTLAKLTGAFAIIVIFLHWLIVRRKDVIKFFASIALAPVCFLLLFLLFQFFIHQHTTNLIYEIQIMMSQSADLTFANSIDPLLVRPWTILISPKLMPYNNHHYFGSISFTLWAVIIPVFAYMVFKSVRKSEAGLFGAAWFTGVFLILFPLSLITDRISYTYYFYPAVGAICIGISMGLCALIDFWQTTRTGNLRWLAISAVVLFLLLHLTTFIILAPINSRQEFTAQDYFDLGVTYQSNEKAIDAYTKAINLDSNYVDALNMRGNFYGFLKDYDKAIADHKKAIQLKPDDPKLYVNLAMDYTAQGNLELALDTYDSVFKLSPDMADAYVKRATIYFGKEQFDLAIQDCTRAIEIDSNSNHVPRLELYLAYANRAKSYYAKQEFQLAFNDLTKSMSFEPYSAEAYYIRGQFYIYFGKINEARADFKKAVEFSDNPQLTQAAKNALDTLD